MGQSHAFRTQERGVEFAGQQITFDVVRNDGKVVRFGMWPDYAKADCELLNKCMSEEMDAQRYHIERNIMMARIR